MIDQKRKYRLTKMHPRFQEKFWKFVQKGEPGECWPWIGPVHPRDDKRGPSRKGDPLCFIKGKSRSTNPQRVCLDVVGTDCKANHGVASTCGNKRCCNPAHLYPTGVDNMGRPPAMTGAQARANLDAELAEMMAEGVI